MPDTNQARVLDLQQAAESEQPYRLNPQLHERVQGDGRAIAVAKLRELADLLENGTLDGVRVQWLDTHGLRVERDGYNEQLALDDESERVEGDKPVSGMEVVTRSAWRADGAGTVQLVTTTIEETGGEG